MQIVIYIIGGVALLVVLVAVVVVRLARTLQARGKALIDARFTADQIVRADTLANYFGLQSQGAAQLRGNGPLVLTREVLWFSQFGVDRELMIPRANIQAVKAVRSHLGKTVGRGLLHITFTGPTGEDAVAFFVRDLAGWTADLAPRAEG